MKNKNKLWVILSLIIVFSAGLIGGIFIERWYLLNKSFSPSSSAARKMGRHFPSLEFMAKELKLTSEQEIKIREIFKNNEEKLRELKHHMYGSLFEIRSKLQGEIGKILTLEQKKKFENMIYKYRHKRRKGMWGKRQRHSQNFIKEKNKGGVK
ncbi:MAG: hypothetical protein ACE5WD_09825 [Candidatus Aminicenantia bacterium]